jgi:hypothetical protein
LLFVTHIFKRLPFVFVFRKLDELSESSLKYLGRFNYNLIGIQILKLLYFDYHYYSFHYLVIAKTISLLPVILDSLRSAISSTCRLTSVASRTKLSCGLNDRIVQFELSDGVRRSVWHCSGNDLKNEKVSKNSSNVKSHFDHFISCHLKKFWNTK